jgi:Xaa-Pro dipeptidase
LRDRVKRIFNNLEKEPEAIIIKNSDENHIDENFFYVTGLNQGLFEGSIAILFPEGNIDLFVPELEFETAKKANLNVNIYKNEKEFYNLLNDSISSFQKIGLNFKAISLRDFLKLKNKLSNVDFFDVSEGIERTRLIKDELEIKLIRKACRIADDVAEKIPDLICEDLYEYELAAEINYLMQKNGADSPAFETISSFGINTAEPHYSHGNVQVRRGDFVLCDFGASVKKYNSDITRTFLFGNATENQKEMYETVLKAQQIAFDTIKPDYKGHEVHNAVDSFIENTKFKGRFIHSTGHSLGLAVHDGGVRLSHNSEVELKENMIFTIEPGVYIPEMGGVRIEDDVLIKNDGIEFLTNSSRELIEI